jgi:hypothetical protein
MQGVPHAQSLCHVHNVSYKGLAITLYIRRVCLITALHKGPYIHHHICIFIIDVTLASRACMHWALTYTMHFISMHFAQMPGFNVPHAFTCTYVHSCTHVRTGRIEHGHWRMHHTQYLFCNVHSWTHWTCYALTLVFHAWHAPCSVRAAHHVRLEWTVYWRLLCISNYGAYKHHIMCVCCALTAHSRAPKVTRLKWTMYGRLLCISNYGAFKHHIMCVCCTLTAHTRAPGVNYVLHAFCASKFMPHAPCPVCVLHTHCTLTNAWSENYVLHVYCALHSFYMHHVLCVQRTHVCSSILLPDSEIVGWRRAPTTAPCLWLARSKMGTTTETSSPSTWHGWIVWGCWMSFCRLR